MAISRSGSCIRVLLIVFNLFVFVAGALLIGFGIHITVKTVQNGLIVVIYGLPIFTLVLGLIVLTAAFIGCYGTCKLKGCLVKWYAILMVLLIIGEITCGTLLFALKNQSLKLIEQYFSSSIYNIESGIGSSQLLNSIKKIQSSLECCGARGPGDWKDPYEFCCSSGRICFRVPQLGCIQAADQVLTEGRLPLGIAIIVLGVIEMGAVACAAFLARQIQQTRSTTASVA